MPATGETTARRLALVDVPPRLWGTGCLSWDIVDGPDLVVVRERMPPGTSEVRHYHARARQAFLVIEGRLEIEAGGETHVLGPAEGLEISPGLSHQVFNRGQGSAEFLAISSPTTKGDRIHPSG